MDRLANKRGTHGQKHIGIEGTAKDKNSPGDGAHLERNIKAERGPQPHAEQSANIKNLRIGIGQRKGWNRQRQGQRPCKHTAHRKAVQRNQPCGQCTDDARNNGHSERNDARCCRVSCDILERDIGSSRLQGGKHHTQ